MKKLIILCILSTFISYSQVRLPKLISNGMVLQRDTDVKIWGWASPGENISINFIDKHSNSTANEKGEWSVTFSNLPAGGPFSMKITGTDSIIIKDILVGDIWLCSGQSNMELKMERASPRYPQEIANSENSFIRYFEVPDRYNFSGPGKDFEYGRWIEAHPANILKFSATGYFFAKSLYEKYKVPIGLIDASLGGTPIEAWMSEKALKEFPGQYNEAQEFKDSTVINRIKQEDKNRIADWYKRLNQNDSILKAGSWKNPDDTSDGWREMQIPGFWADQGAGPVNGSVWFKRDITVPESIAGKQVRLLLGRIVDADSVFINNTFIGTTGYQYPPRRYVIPAGVLKEGRNSIIVRVISNSGIGGFVKDKPYEIISEDQILDLKGAWKYAVGAVMEPLKEQTFITYKPVGLFNAMIAPLIDYSIKGAIWYQGESNTWRPLEYRKLLPAMITDWRKHWDRDFPFLFVQLPNFMEPKSEPGESSWALLREAQLKTLSLPNTAMAVTIDLGEWNDVHPLNKKDVGTRLALAAQKIAYGEKDVISSGPIFHSMIIENDKAKLSFTEVDGGLAAKGGGDLQGFSISGADNKFVWAKAKIENDTVTVWSDEVQHPVAVRYAWADNPEGANLYNKAGLPASPFRTDDF